MSIVTKKKSVWLITIKSVIIAIVTEELRSDVGHGGRGSGGDTFLSVSLCALVPPTESVELT